jgi:hypothetical protein
VVIAIGGVSLRMVEYDRLSVAPDVIAERGFKRQLASDRKTETDVVQHRAGRQ